MERTGFSAYWKREFRPYLRAAAEQFAPEHVSMTERLIRKRTTKTSPKPEPDSMVP
jgi:type VI protein secretion system component VasA